MNRRTKPKRKSEPFKKKEEYKKKSRSPFKKKEEDRDKQRSSYKKKEEGGVDNKNRKPFKKREDAPFKKRTSSHNKEEEGDRKRKPFKKREDAPFKKRTSSHNKEEGDRKRKPFKKKDDRDGAPYKKKAGSFKKKKPESSVSEDGLTRLNKFIANSGICSRREADEFIKAGLVAVNGNIITEMGYKVRAGDEVRYEGERIKSEKKIYLLLNKPKNYISTVDDPLMRKTVMELIGKACKERIYPVGRLDRATTGVLLFTNDGDLTKTLTHPKFGVKKIYHVVLDKNLKGSDMAKIAEGFTLEDGFIKADVISYVGDGGKKNEIGIELHSGKNRIVRRIFEHFQYQVVKLDRVLFAGLTKKDLPRGRWRMLTETEVGILKMAGHTRSKSKMRY